MGPYTASEDSAFELVPAISLVVEGDDIPTSPWADGATRWTLEDVAEWHARRREILGLDPDRPIEGLTALDEITSDRLLDAVADYVCDCADEYGWAPFLDGGFVLVVDGQVFSRPTCCVDLAEGVADWIRLAEEWPADWTGVESGHPGVLARRVKDRVEVSEQTDDFPSPIVARVEFSVTQLQAALPPALQAIFSFASRLEPRLDARGVDQPAARASTVAGLSNAASLP